MRKHFLFILFLLNAFVSCQKIELKNDAALDKLSLTNASGASFQLESAPFVPIDDDSIERPTTLGIQLTNPYLVPNMQQAYANLGLSSSKAVVNNWYVRFLPSGIDQLATLDSIMDAQGLELFDTPMDYDITYEGDYYQDPSIPDSLPTWQYAVVPPNFVFSSGIQHQTLAQIHIPGDSYTAVETEAERLASIQDSLNMQMMMAQTNGMVHPNVPQCGPGYEWNYQLGKCVPVLPEECGEGYHCDGTMCVPDNPPVQDPPPASPDAAIPAGYIYVHDTNLDTDVPVRKARIVAKRWFKIERTYTDNSGHFTCTKHFKHKVKINVKFKNEYANVRGMRGIRLWQMLFPVKKTIGVFSGDKSNVLYVAKLTQTLAYIPGIGTIDITSSNKSTRYWAAATTLNSVQEYRDYATTEGIGLPPTGLKIILSNWGSGGNGASPLYAKRHSDNLLQSLFDWVVGSYPPPFNQIYQVLKKQVDMLVSYNYGGYGSIVSDKLKEVFYHELTHAAQYNTLGATWYNSFVTAEEFEINYTDFNDPGASPYGRGSDSYSPIIALGEAWAYHIGEYLADKRYGSTSSDYGEQFIAYPNGYIYGLSSHLIALENYDPHLSGYPFDWIPKGIFYDMIDGRNDATANPLFVNINDQVNQSTNFYTNQKLFNAFNSSITTLSSYKQNLLQQNSNNQSTQITSLFSQYDY